LCIYFVFCKILIFFFVIYGRLFRILLNKFFSTCRLIMKERKRLSINLTSIEDLVVYKWLVSRTYTNTRDKVSSKGIYIVK